MVVWTGRDDWVIDYRGLWRNYIVPLSICYTCESMTTHIEHERKQSVTHDKYWKTKSTPRVFTQIVRAKDGYQAINISIILIMWIRSLVESNK